MTEARVRTVFGEIRFTYETGEQLEKILSRIPGEAAAIAKAARSFAPQPDAAPATGPGKKGKAGGKRKRG